MDISVTYPAPGKILFQSDFLFRDPSNELCHEFVRRMTDSPAVTGITIQCQTAAKGKRARNRPAVAEVQYCPKTRTRKQAVEELYARLLRGGDANRC